MRFFIFLIFSTSLYAQNNCGNDYNCFYERQARIIEQDRQRQEQKLDEYRNQQLQLEEAQLQEVQKQNSLLEEQINLEQKQQESTHKDQIKKKL